VLILRDRKFVEAALDSEEELERVVVANSDYLFGPSSIYFPKALMRTTDGSGTIPDGFVVDLSTRKWFVVGRSGVGKAQCLGTHRPTGCQADGCGDELPIHGLIVGDIVWTGWMEGGLVVGTGPNPGCRASDPPTQNRAITAAVVRERCRFIWHLRWWGR
jgi:hypothetical protein